MKKLTVIINPGRFDDIKQLFESCAVYGMMITNIMGYGNQKGFTTVYRGVKTPTNILMKTKVETVCDDETAEVLVKLITGKMATGNIGDGKIFLEEIPDIVRIRTCERGEAAL
jgi:nitrogen regulatory protein PII